MKIRVQQLALKDATTPLLVVAHFEGEEPRDGLAEINSSLDNVVSKLIADGELTGKLNESLLLHTFGRLKADRVLIVGLGKRADLTQDRVRQAAGAAAKRARRLKLPQYVISFFGAAQGVSAQDAAQAITEGS